ncbi:MAG: peptidase domain-containing ABC transporter [Planctomycetes bacterium]|nr:peptidase domain-containing ABC transporter [Planctomycetota bacterium]
MLLFPHVQQQDESDCGAACLAILLACRGKRVSLARLRDLANVTTEGASMASLAEAARRLGFTARGMELSYEVLSRYPLPAIAHWEGNHYVVLYRVSRTHAWVSDPALDRIRYTRAQFERSWTGRVLVIEPTDEIRTIGKPRTPWRRFVAHLRTSACLLVEVFLAGLGMLVLGTVLPLFIQQIVDRVAVTGSRSLLDALLAGLLAATVGALVLYGVRAYLLAHVSWRTSVSLAGSFYRHLLALPARFFEVRRTGDILARFADGERVSELLGGRPIQIVLDASLVLAYVGLMLYFSLPLTLIVLVFLSSFLVLALAFVPVLKRANRRVFAARARERSAFLESVTGIETAKALDLERSLRSKWEGLFLAAQRIGHRANLVALSFRALTGGVSSFAVVVLLWYGARRVAGGEMTIGELLAFHIVAVSVFHPLLGLISSWEEFQQGTVSVERLTEVLTSRTETETRRTRFEPPRLEGHVRFENVFFRYGADDSPYALKSVSFEVHPGQVLAVVGRSGCGKTTLGRLLLGLHVAQEGRILVDEIDVREIDLATLRRNIATVPQEVSLFQGTVWQNVHAGHGDPDLHRVIEAARLAGAHEFISELAGGYKARVAEKGANLSAGERQRLSLARALYRSPQILVFDEPTSALDAESEDALWKNLEPCFLARTAILLAHRMGTVRRADRILVLEDGEVVEAGTEAELLAKRGLYASFSDRIPC